MTKLNSYLVVFAIFAVTFSLIISSCKKDESIIQENSSHEVLLKTLEEETALDDFLLPIGTKVKTLPSGSLDIELPENYQFLLFDKTNGLNFSSFAGYSCTCSAENSCTVFYNSGLGYGCLQNDCSGTCTGAVSGGISQRSIAHGIINNKVDHLISSEFVSPGNLSEKGYEIFFQHLVKDELSSFFQFAFEGSGFENGNELISIKGIGNTSQVLLQYKGISFSAVVPNFENVKKSQFSKIDSGPSITCVGNSGCSCSQDKKCILGNCVYYCSGCTTCTMSVDEQ